MRASGKVLRLLHQRILKHLRSQRLHGAEARRLLAHLIKRSQP